MYEIPRFLKFVETFKRPYPGRRSDRLTDTQLWRRAWARAGHVGGLDPDDDVTVATFVGCSVEVLDDYERSKPSRQLREFRGRVTLLVSP